MEFSLIDEVVDENTNAAISFLNEHADEDVVLRIDSIGGDVFAGLRLCQAIQNHKGTVTARCGVVVASIAAVIACSCDKIQLTKDTFFMVHEAWCCCVGTASELLSTATLLEQASSRIQEIVGAKAINADAVKDWFTKDTWFGYQAMMDSFKDVELVDADGKLTSAAMACLSKLKTKPDALLELAAKVKDAEKAEADRLAAEAEAKKKAELQDKIQKILDKTEKILND